MEPPRVRLEVERRDRWTVDLNRDLVQVDAGPLETRLLYETASFTPRSAVILGPAFGMDRFAQKWKTGTKLFRAKLQIDSERLATGRLEIIDEKVLDIYFEQQPSVTIQLRPLASTFMLEVPVLVDDLSLPPEERGRYVPEQLAKPVLVSVSGPLRADLTMLGGEESPQKLQEWARDNLRLVAYVPRAETAEVVLEELSRPAYLVLTGPRPRRDTSECMLVDPVLVRLRREER
jgi:hypothetical protein